jgi:hypothetical protein
MKKITLAIFSLGIILIVFQSFSTKRTREREGTEPGHTGSPGDDYKTCTTCHGGTNEFKEGWITSNVPETGFEPGKRYTITATNTRVGNTRFGFLIAPQDIEGNLQGQLIITDSIETKLVGDDSYVTYRAAGVESVDARIWSFDWIAPDEDSVTFYGAFNSNHDGHKWVDNTVTSQLKLKRKSLVNIIKTVENDLKIYPNPTTEFINLNVSLDNKQIKIVDIVGKIVFESDNLSNNHLEVKHLTQGTYFIFIVDGSTTYTSKFVKL